MKRSRHEADLQNRGRDEIAKRLRELIESHDYNVARLERQMRRGRGYVAEALRGGKKLTVELIVEILAALDVKLEEIFAARKTRHLDAALADSTPELPAAMRDASPLLQALVLTLAAKGVLSVDEIEERQRELVGTTVDERPPGKR